MNWTFLKHEFLLTYRSKKNIPFVVFLCIALLSYCFLFVPNKVTQETFNVDEVKSKLTELKAEQDYRLAKGNTGIILFSGSPVFFLNAESYGLFSAMLAAYEDGNATRWLHLRANYLERETSVYTADQELFKDSPFPGKDRLHLYNQTMLRYDTYLAKEHPITFGMIEEKTGLQALQKFFQQYGMYFVLFCAIYFSSDLLSRDRQNKTVLQGLPMSWYRQLNLKTLSSFFYTHAVVGIVLGLGVLLIALQYGFGYFDLKIPTILIKDEYPREYYDVMTIASFLGKVAMIIPVLVYLFIRLNVIFSLIFKNEWLVLVISSLLLFSEKLYLTRTSRELLGVDISFFPQTYFDFGNVITGEKNFLLNTTTMDFSTGILVLLVTVVVIEVLLFVLSRIFNKRRFYSIG
ncbi:hypothetical protein NCCP2222_07270 [Sporosarcina sp. NCCP-2222]|uniref:hypothetical protein n=1 Tax=Sporosarcina sp. NCCP-2222 TaxID=2935073 RepID=UPI0020817387|nr:hypothetical protein [Sporosarcina sp. NCCP-2222]GKV54780.1 hypothetical protein NCCP2222_07270 [Sporosarcina sp. NCCP-2222]